MSTMFWIETIKPGDKFCTCMSGWKQFRIINIEVTGFIFNLYMTPQYGESVFVIAQKADEIFPAKFNFDFKFQNYEHVKMEVYLGQITIVGEVINSVHLNRGVSHNFFPINCPFGKEYWDEIARIEKQSGE